MHLYEVLRRPLITEKDTALQAAGKYSFEVAREANKPQIKQAVERAFKVKVNAVNVLTVPSKGTAGVDPVLEKGDSYPQARGQDWVL